MIGRAVLLGACALVLTSGETARAAPQIGMAAAISNKVSGTSGGPARPIRTGDSVFQDQTVMTAAKSSAQLLFRDETALTVGPVSQVKLDRFVYDPSRRTGKIVINMAKGAFRFVSGAARSQSYRIQTPVASIAVRGTIFDTFHHANTTVAVLVQGGIDVCARGTARCIAVNRPGQYAIVRADGSVSGPHDWNGALWDVNLGVPFPLFGRRQANDFSDQTMTPGDLNDVIDNGGLSGGQGSGGGGGGGGGVIVIP